MCKLFLLVIPVFLINFTKFIPGIFENEFPKTIENYLFCLYFNVRLSMSKIKPFILLMSKYRLHSSKKLEIDKISTENPNFKIGVKYWRKLLFIKIERYEPSWKRELGLRHF